MDLPVLEILQVLKGREKIIGDVDVWTEYIETFAPTYLVQEATGHGFAYEYNHDKFIENIPETRFTRDYN